MSLSASSVLFSFSSGQPSKPSSCRCVLQERLQPQIKEISSPQLLLFTNQPLFSFIKAGNAWFSKCGLWLSWKQFRLIPKKSTEVYSDVSHPWFSITRLDSDQTTSHEFWTTWILNFGSKDNTQTMGGNIWSSMFLYLWGGAADRMSLFERVPRFSSDRIKVVGGTSIKTVFWPHLPASSVAPFMHFSRMSRCFCRKTDTGCRPLLWPDCHLTCKCPHWAIYFKGKCPIRQKVYLMSQINFDILIQHFPGMFYCRIVVICYFCENLFSAASPAFRLFSNTIPYLLCKSDVYPAACVSASLQEKGDAAGIIRVCTGGAGNACHHERFRSWKSLEDAFVLSERAPQHSKGLEKRFSSSWLMAALLITIRETMCVRKLKPLQHMWEGLSVWSIIH